MDVRRNEGRGRGKMRGPSLGGKGLEISAGVGGYLALRDEDLIMVSVGFRQCLRVLRPHTLFFGVFDCYCLSL